MTRSLFRLPAYIWMLHDTDNSEYVLLEESTRTIHYIACQTDELAALAMPEGWYPGESLRAVRIAPPRERRMHHDLPAVRHRECR